MMEAGFDNLDCRRLTVDDTQLSLPNDVRPVAAAVTMTTL